MPDYSVHATDGNVRSSEAKRRLGSRCSDKHNVRPIRYDWHR